MAEEAGGRRRGREGTGILFTLLAALLAAVILGLPQRPPAPVRHAPPRAASTATRFVVMGDSRARSSSQRLTNGPVLGRLATVIAELRPRPRFLLFNGDYANFEPGDGVGDHYAEWRRAMQPASAAGIAHLPVLGNHEEDVAEFARNFDAAAAAAAAGGRFTAMPSDPWTYSVDFGRFHVLVLNNYPPPPDAPGAKITAAQLRFAEGALEANSSVPSIVASHEPAFPVAKHIGGSLDRRPVLRDRLCRTMDSLGARLLVVGHEHHYSRLTIDSSLVKGMRGKVLQLQSSTAGIAATRGPRRRTDFFRARAYAFTLVDVADRGLELRTFDQHGAVIDAAFVPTGD